MKKKDLLTDLPAAEVMALRAHLDEAIADPEYTIVVNYPIENVVRVAKYYGMDISNVEVHSLPCAPIGELLAFRQRLDEVKEKA